MKINKKSLQARVKNIANQRNVSANIIYTRYFFDTFLIRLSKSKYRNNLILKGGLYLSSILGISNRSTLDIDFSFQNKKFEHDELVKIIKDICEIDVDDNVIFKYLSDTEIKKSDDYNGYSIKLEAKLENIVQIFNIDIATGDSIYPRVLDYKYECILTNELIDLKGYPIECVISEKLETFLERGVLNSRSKDLYDLYILNKIYYDKIKNIKITFEKTCTNRNFLINKDKAFMTFNLVKNNINQKKRWEIYSKHVDYAKDLSFEEVLNSIESFLMIVFD